MSSKSSVQVSVKLDGIAEAKQGLKDVSDGFKQAGDSAKDFKSTSDKFNEMGALFKKVGKQFTKYLTVPIIGGMGALGKMFSNLEYEVARVGTLTSEAFDLTKYTQDLLDQSKITGVDTTQLSKNVYTALTASVPEDYVMDFVFDAHKLATAGFTDEATAIDVLTTAINAYGYEASDANKISDMLIGTQDRGKTTVDELGKSLGDVIPIASDNNLSFEELSASMALLTRNGIGTARASTYTRSMLQELGKTGSRSDVALRELAGKGFRELMDEGYNLSDVLQMLDGYAVANGLTLQDMFGNIRAGTGAMSLMSGEGEHLSELIEYMGGVAGRTDENFEDMTQTMQYRTRVAFNRLKTAGYDLALNLAPVWENVADVMVTVAEKVEGAVKWFTGLEDATQGNIVKFGLFLAVLGPILSVLGGLFSVVGTVTGALGLMSGATTVAVPAVAGLATVMGFLSNPITLTIGGIGLMTGALAVLAKGLGEETTPLVKEFGDEVSETTAEAVTNFRDMTSEANVALKELTWGQQEYTQEMVEDMEAKQALITAELLGAIDARHKEERAEVEGHLANISALTEKEKADTLTKLDERYEEERTITKEGQDRINEIVALGLEQEGGLRQDQLDEILYIRETMELQMIDIMSQSEVEQKAILEQMAFNSESITAQEAIDVAKNAQEKKDAVVEEALQQYEDVTAFAIRQRDETGEWSAEEASRVIEEAERKKSEVITKAEETHQKVLEEAVAQADGHVRITEEGNLEVVTRWTKMKDELGRLGNLISKDTESSFREVTATTETETGKQETSSRKNWEKMGGTMAQSMKEVDISTANGLQVALGTIDGQYSAFESAGSMISKMIASGVSSSGGLIGKAVSGALSLARNLLPFSPPKDKSSPMYGIENNGISGNIADGIRSGGGEIDLAMRQVLQNDLASQYQRNNSVSKPRTASIQKSEPKAKQPIELIVQLGNHEFRKFVSDITDIQDKDLGFTKSFGV